MAAITATVTNANTKTLGLTGDTTGTLSFDTSSDSAIGLPSSQGKFRGLATINNVPYYFTLCDATGTTTTCVDANGNEIGEIVILFEATATIDFPSYGDQFNWYKSLFEYETDMSFIYDRPYQPPPAPPRVVIDTNGVVDSSTSLAVHDSTATGAVVGSITFNCAGCGAPNVDKKYIGEYTFGATTLQFHLCDSTGLKWKCDSELLCIDGNLNDCRILYYAAAGADYSWYNVARP
jgi:hypothetical protein